MNGLVGAVVGGVIGGVIGAAIWAGISYATNYEVGWIAWGIGALVGICVAAGNREGGVANGAIAVVISVASIVGGKYAAVQLLINNELGGTGEFADEIASEFNDSTTAIVSYIADGIVEEYGQQGKPVRWPQGVDPEFATKEDEYPSDVWQDATDRWTAMTPDEQSQYRQEVAEFIRADVAAAMDQFRQDVAHEGFIESFSMFDILFFGLAIVTAFKIAESAQIGGADV